ncbi:50S ribosomal protein L11 methyltransferase [Thiohalobacter sp.]|uniref:50S ribosomal protein L11 methyltransferase n=1 Tax=Thiohalobacter sp. TaxID=2025948 RepID=UPI00398381E6
MPWLQLSLEAGAQDPEHLSDLFTGLGALSVTLVDAADEPVLEPGPGETPLWSRTRVVALFDAGIDPDAVRAGLARHIGEAAQRMTAEPLEDRDWTRAWLDDFAPMRFGERLWVIPGDMAPPEPDAVNLLLDPGLAFGTGTHPTTALCLSWLDAHPPAGRDVIDYGCGSGILAIAALKLGARRVRGVDIDPQALTASRDNARRNGVDAALSLFLPDELPAGPADLLLANILANPLIELAPTLVSLVRPGGRLVLSGILAAQADAVAAVYRPHGELEPVVEQDGWVRLVVRRPITPPDSARASSGLR